MNGYALYLAKGKLTFTVCRGGERTVIAAKDPLAKGHHAVAATLRDRGTMTLVVDGKEVARGEAGGLIAQQPFYGLAVGSAPFMAVGDYETPNPFRGNVTDVRAEDHRAFERPVSGRIRAHKGDRRCEPSIQRTTLFHPGVGL